jgi:hypothetical protein
MFKGMNWRGFGRVAAGFAMVAGVVGCDNPVTPDPAHRTAQGVVITNMNGAVIAETHGDHWDFASGDAIHLHPGDDLEVRIFFVATSGERFQLINDPEYQLVVEIADPTVVTYDAHGDHGDFEARSEGETTAVIHLWHGSHPGGHPDYSAPPLTIEVDGHGHG